MNDQATSTRIEAVQDEIRLRPCTMSFTPLRSKPIDNESDRRINILTADIRQMEESAFAIRIAGLYPKCQRQSISALGFPAPTYRITIRTDLPRLLVQASGELGTLRPQAQYTITKHDKRLDLWVE